jgi:hypothetical protein
LIEDLRVDTRNRFSEQLENNAGPVRRRLNFGARLIVALVFTLGLACCIWAGWFAGAVYGMTQAEPILTGPAAPGVGLAPNIAPAIGGVIEIGGGALVGIGIGIVSGIVVMMLLCRFVVVPVLRRVSRLTLECAE